MSFASFPHMLGGGCREELVFCAAGSAGPSLPSPRGASDPAKTISTFFRSRRKNDIDLDLGDYARPVSSGFMAALWLKLAETAGVSAATA